MTFDVFVAVIVQITAFSVVLKADTDVSEEHAASIFRVSAYKIKRCHSPEDHNLKMHFDLLHFVIVVVVCSAGHVT
jgi:hypothetical protein